MCDCVRLLSVLKAEVIPETTEVIMIQILMLRLCKIVVNSVVSVHTSRLEINVYRKGDKYVQEL